MRLLSFIILLCATLGSKAIGSEKPIDKFPTLTTANGKSIVLGFDLQYDGLQRFFENPNQDPCQYDYYLKNSPFKKGQVILKDKNDTRLHQWYQKGKKAIEDKARTFTTFQEYPEEVILKAILANQKSLKSLCGTIYKQELQRIKFSTPDKDLVQSMLAPHPDKKPLGFYKQRNGGKVKPAVDLEALFNLDRIHQISFGKDIKVGIIEDGLDTEHPDIMDNLTQTTINNPKVKKCDHGTAVSSVIKKVAPQAKISLLAKNKDKKGLDGWDCKKQTLTAFLKQENENNLVNDIEYAIEKKIQVMNISRNIGGACSCNKRTCYNCKITDNVKNALLKVTKSGALIVKSAGNEGGTNHENTDYYKSMVNIAKSTGGRMLLVGNLKYTEDGQEILSSHSVKATHNKDPFICAPGSQIMVATQQTKHDVQSGTSFAAPVVTAALSLLMEAFPIWKDTPEKYIDLILRSARKVSLDGKVLGPEYGHGILDVKAALELGAKEDLTHLQQNPLSTTDNSNGLELDSKSFDTLFNAGEGELVMNGKFKIIEAKTLPSAAEHPLLFPHNDVVHPLLRHFPYYTFVKKDENGKKEKYLTLKCLDTKEEEHIKK